MKNKRLEEYVKLHTERIDGYGDVVGLSNIGRIIADAENGIRKAAIEAYAEQCLTSINSECEKWQCGMCDKLIGFVKKLDNYIID